MVTDATKGTRVDTAYGRLKTELRSNRMPAGYTVPETEIAALLGMSRTPVREALIRLEAEGLIELIPRRGMRVLPIKPSDMREIYEILVSVEPDAAARVAAMGLSDAALAPLERAMTQMEAAVEARDLEKWAEADDRFHQTLLELSGNRRLGAIVEQLYDQAHRARMMTLRLREFPSQSTAEHRALFEHLRQGQAKEAYDAFRAHRLRTMDELLAHLEKLGFAPV